MFSKSPESVELLAPMSLLHLYDTILVPILSDWIWSDDLCCLDTAVCSTQLRPSWLVTLSKSKVLNPKYCVSLEDTEWMLLRGVQQRILHVQDRVDISDKTTSVLCKHLSLVSVELFEKDEGEEKKEEKKLEQLLLNHTIDKLKVSIEKCDAFPTKYGSMIVDLYLSESANEDFYRSLSACCPLLKHFSTGSYEYESAPILPLIQGCDLDSIKGSSLKYLLKQSDKTQNHRCDLVRIPMQDEKSVCLGEGKYYRVTGLDVDDANDDEIGLITPYLCTLIQLRLNKSKTLARLASVHCKNLTSLDVSAVHTMIKEVIALIKHSKQLLELEISNEAYNISTNGKKLILTAAVHCHQLKVFRLGNGIVPEHRAMSQLFQKCLALEDVKVECDWDASSVVHFAKNADRLTFNYSGGQSNIRRLGRCGRRLYLACNMPEGTLIDVVKQNPGVRYLCLKHYPYTEDAVVDQLVVLCPHLTGLVISDGTAVGQRLCSVAQCDKLRSVTLLSLKFADESVLMELFRNKTHLKHLKLNSCGTFSGDVFNLIAATCSELKSLDLSRCHITTKQVVALLTSCLQLKKLLLTWCPVDSEVLPFIKYAPCLREVELRRCNVSEDMIAEFNEVRTIKITISASPW